MHLFLFLLLLLLLLLLSAAAAAAAAAGVHKLSKVRTSDGMFFGRAEDEVVKRIEDRVAAWTMLPAGHAEGMQVLRYVVS
jgi:prolyl 4-hydroxylase